MTSGRSRPSGSKRRLSTFRTSRAQLRLDAPIVLSCSRRWRFSSFVERSPSCECGVRLVDERALDDGERGDDPRSGRGHAQSASLAYGIAGAPCSPFAKPPARRAIRSSSSARSPGSGTARPSAERRKRLDRLGVRVGEQVALAKRRQQVGLARQQRARRRTGSSVGVSRARPASARRTGPRFGGKLPERHRPGASKSSWQRVRATLKTTRACAKRCVRGSPRSSAIAPSRRACRSCSTSRLDPSRRDGRRPAAA